VHGADGLPGRLSWLGFGVLGVAHAAMQLVLPYLLISRGWLVAAATIAAMLIAFAPLGYAMYRRAPAVLITALWLIQGLGAIAVLYWGPWGFVSEGWWSSTPLALLVGGLVVPMQFGFYLLTCGAWSGHNNEAGITARATACKQWIRFHVTRDALTGYVIGIDDPTRSCAPRLIDRFVIAPAAASHEVAPAPAGDASSSPVVP
jgi:hypothetical protein